MPGMLFMPGISCFIGAGAAFFGVVAFAGVLVVVFVFVVLAAAFFTGARADEMPATAFFAPAIAA